ncbi:AEC family transporter [Reyranella sp. CPCC 100927]|nr:AEC family transporter [Reyranella sp. CPCC 100927]
MLDQIAQGVDLRLREVAVGRRRQHHRPDQAILQRRHAHSLRIASPCTCARRGRAGQASSTTRRLAARPLMCPRRISGFPARRGSGPFVQVLLTVAFPIFALIGTGWVAGRLRLLGEHGTTALNAFVGWFALPAMLFAALAKVSIADVLNGPFVVVFGGSMLLTYVAGMVAARVVARARLAHMSLFGLSASFGNVGYMGIPLCVTAFGSEGALPGTLATILGAAGILTFGLILVEIDIQGGRGTPAVRGRVMKAVVRSPIVQAVTLGVLVSALRIAVPEPVLRFLELLGSAAAPCALFAIGLFLSDKGLGTSRLEVALASVGKVLLQPLIAVALLPWFLDLDTMWGKAAVLCAALPTAANAFVIAKEYETFVEGASGTILVSTVTSVATVSALLVLLRVG